MKGEGLKGILLKFASMSMIEKGELQIGAIFESFMRLRLMPQALFYRLLQLTDRCSGSAGFLCGF